jgi:hypothetical protein
VGCWRFICSSLTVESTLGKRRYDSHSLYFYIRIEYQLCDTNNILFIERLVVIRELGVHIHTKYWSGKESSLFVDKTRIKAVVINEGFRFYTVITYLAFIVDGEDKLICAFQVRKSFHFINIMPFIEY